MTTANLRHVQALDGVRGTALLLVFCYHLLGSNPLPSHPLLDLLLKTAGTGWIGVDLFFALSGFLITGILYDSLESPNYLRNFYLRRVCRIFPLYYFFILLLFLIFTVGIPLNTRPLSLLPLYLQNTPLWWNNIHGGKVAAASSHLWSLAVEEQFYLAWPLIVLAVRKRQKLLWIALALVCAAPIARSILIMNGPPFDATYKLTFCRMDALLAGGWLALMVRGDRPQIIRSYAPITFLASIAGCFAIAWTTGNFDWHTNRSVNQFGYTLLAIAATSLIAMSLNGNSLIAKIMSAKPLRVVGRYSFGLYVYQPLASVLVGIGFAHSLHRHIHSPLAYRLALELIVLIATSTAALLSFHFLETPFLRLKRFFTADPLQPSPQRPPTAGVSVALDN
jgi:peptidoglycan/LPS O-acetylase OafA/YrhL